MAPVGVVTPQPRAAAISVVQCSDEEGEVEEEEEEMDLRWIFDEKQAWNAQLSYGDLGALFIRLDRDQVRGFSTFFLDYILYGLVGTNKNGH